MNNININRAQLTELMTLSSTTDMTLIDKIFVHLHLLSTGETRKIIGIDKSYTVDNLYQEFNKLQKYKITKAKYNEQFFHLRNIGYIKIYAGSEMFISITNHFEDMENLLTEILMYESEYGLNNIPSRRLTLASIFTRLNGNHISYVNINPFENHNLALLDEDDEVNITNDEHKCDIDGMN